MDYENQIMIENIFNKRQTLKMIRHHLMASKTVVQEIAKTDLDPEFCLDLLAQMVLHKRTTVDVLVGLLKGYFQSLQECADALLRAAEADLMDFDPVDERFVLRFELGEKEHALIRQYKYLPPMTVPPLEVIGNKGSGYLTIRGDSLILKDNHHEGDICLDSINKFNAIPLSINERVVKGIRNQWKNLEKPKEGESFEDYTKRLKAFEQFEKDSFFTMALMIEMGNRFHFTHKVDKRGRTYSQGYYVDYQGNDYCKAVIEFADKEMIQ